MDDDSFDLKPPPPRVSKFKVFCILLHLTLCVLCCTWWRASDGSVNWLGLYLNLGMVILHCIDMYIRLRRVLWLERCHRHLKAMRRIAATSTVQFDKETNTIAYNWFVVVSPTKLDEMMRRKKK